VCVKSKIGKIITNSVLEAHRINSECIARAAGFDVIKNAIGHVDGEAFRPKQLAGTLVRYDINALLHGVFLEEIAGVLRLPRSLSAFIEAESVSAASSGGAKINRLRPGLKDGEGNVIYSREEFVSSKITAFFNLDLAQIRGYGLGENVTRLLIALAFFKIQAFLKSGLRLRTACDLDCESLVVTRPKGFEMPTLEELEKELPGLVEKVASGTEVAQRSGNHGGMGGRW
jgi:CRISPR-associated protein Csb1